MPLSHEIKYLSEQEVASSIGVGTDTLRKWRADGCGPVWQQWKNGAYYRSEDLDDWMRKVASGWSRV